MDLRYLVSTRLRESYQQLRGNEDGKRGAIAAGVVRAMVVD